MRPSPEDPNSQLAFRPREKEKMKLRRMSKANDLEYLRKFQSLRYNLNFSKSLIDRVKMREILKTDQLELTIQSIYF